MPYSDATPSAVVTGASSGIGEVTAVRLAASGFRVGLACRSYERTKPVLDQIHAAGGCAEWIPLDLASLESTKAAADAVVDRFGTIGLLVNNAGAGQRGLSPDGFELAWQSNYLSHYLFTRLLIPTLSGAKHARVVNVASKEHLRAHSIDWDALRRSSTKMTLREPLHDYGVAKLAVVAFSRHLADLAPAQVHTYALHPGVIATNAYRDLPRAIRAATRPFMKTPTHGALTTLMCATSDDTAADTGLYYSNQAQAKPNPLVDDPHFRQDLWERSAGMVGLPV